ncbi:ArpU family phage packaging/lysis transcriptional regulator [Marinilactibacillus psychrotolerans]|uniref:ArpU family phage packaging/lysis transcriptional regulator n=1 Tax=Marinilactibacillus psychrotolerans TaxID=191770 RepID=UPI0038851481
MLDIFLEVDNIDKKATKENVDELLSLYRRLARMADEEYMPKMTATYSFEIKGSGGGVSDSLGEAISRSVSAQQEINKIMKAVNKMNSYQRQLIFEKYIKRRQQTDIMIYIGLNMSESTFYRELEKAQLEFAEAYDNGRLLLIH